MNLTISGKSSRIEKSPGLLVAESWIWFSTWCVVSGWGLSLAGQLNFRGYSACAVVGFLLLCRRLRAAGDELALFGNRLRMGALRRFRKALPLLFALAAVLAFIGGALYQPNNYDAITYRLPRMLNWLAQGKWYWIDTTCHRMNYSGLDSEWLSLPFLVLGNSDRLLFLPNFLSFLLLPSLVFSCFRRLGIGGRASWFWMWLLPMGYCYLLQAASIGNDSYAAVYLLASVTFALRAKKSGRVADVWISLLSAALLSGTKLSNAPLLLPCGIALLPSLKLLARKWWIGIPIAVAAFAASFLPLVALNQKCAGGWTGDPQNSEKMSLSSPVSGVLGNGFLLLANNLTPPLFPAARKWNGDFEHFTETNGLAKRLKANYPRFGLVASEIPNEEGAGLGFGLTVLLGATLLASLRKLRASFGDEAKMGLLICAGTLVAFLVYCAKLGSESISRLVAPYYPLCIATVLLLATSSHTRARWWRGLALLAVASSFIPLVLTPSRPLFPAVAIFNRISQRYPHNALVQRASQVYSIYAKRADVFGPLRRHFPAKTDGSKLMIGLLVSGDDPEASLWRPYGTSRVIDIDPASEEASGRRVPLDCTVFSSRALFELAGKHLDEWLAENNSVVLGKETLLVRVPRGPEEWYVVAPKK